QHLPRRLSSRDAFRVRRKDRQVAVPPRGERASLHLLDFSRELGVADLVSVEQLHPLSPRGCTALAHLLGEMLVDASRHEELLVFGPSVAAFDQADFVVAERFAVRFCCVLLVRRTVADMTVENDEWAPALRVSEYLEGVLDAIDVVGISHSQHVP